MYRSPLTPITLRRTRRRGFEDVAQEDETLPDPDEELMLDRGNGRVWLVKIPKHLMARWAAIDKEDVHLATIPPRDGSPRIFLFLPPDPNDPTTRASNLPSFQPDAAYIPAGDGGVHVDRYELDMVNEAVENQLVIAERPKDPVVPPSGTAAAHTYNSRARTTILTGRVKHECNLRPVFNESYRRQMRERTRAYNTPQRQIRMIEEAGLSGGRGGINRLSSGVATGSFADMIKTKQKPVKGTFERMARLPRNQLLDLLFQLFREQPRWSFKPLRERTQQPETYLKEVLNDIATLHRSGEYNGMWELSEIFAKDGVSVFPVTLIFLSKEKTCPGPSSLGSGDVTMEDHDEDDNDDDNDDDDDDDMEEIS
ncbi:transcription initiation factor IIF, beta subunit-domain-containing protein [Melanogaster broomeanus]|nr:transcription initiation factor IIF, beta subunit-domain-containing protein [Melanogaster broomeanus]